MKTDARTRYTLHAIKQALLTRLKEKEIEAITVRELCQLAEINRSTFYRHYDNQYGLLASLQDEMFAQIKKEILARRPNTEELILLMFQLVYQNQEEWLLLLGEHADSRISKKITRFISEYLRIPSESEAGRMKYQFLLAGASGLFTDWIQSGMRETPEKMAEYLNTYSRCLKNT